MAVVTNTFQTTSAVGNREELSNIVSRITPEETPIYSMASKGDAKSVHPEWETDKLAVPKANAQLEGDEYSFNAIDVPVRLGNYTQIFRNSWIISETQEEVDNAGNNQKMAEQKIKKGIETRKDVELSILSNSASVAGATRVSGGLPSWITTNVSRGTGGANGGFNTGTGLTVAATNGTQRAFSQTLMDDVMQSAYSAGGNPNKLVLSPYNKRVFVTFMSNTNVAPFRYTAKTNGKNTILSNADMYEGPFGELAVIPNRVMTANPAVSAALSRNAFLIDDDYLQFAWLRPIRNVPNIAKTGDAHKGVIIGEGTLKVKNEQALGIIADLFGVNATT